MSGRGPMMDTSADRLIQEPAPVVEPARAQRGIRGLYLPSQCGRLAADGSLLNETTYDYAIAPAWRDPACEIFRCWRPEVLRMVPPEARRCRLHGSQPLPPEDPFPLEGEEYRVAEATTWAALAPKYGVPARYANVSFDTCDSTPALEAARTHVSDDHTSGGTVLEGGTGAGKSTGLRAAQRHLVIDMTRHGRKDVIKLLTFPQLSRLLLDEDERDETLEACCEADELILDDLGAGFTKPGGFVVSCVEQIVIAREEAIAPLLMATNLKPTQFRALFGDRVFDRLRGEWGAWLNVDRPSLRRKRQPPR